MSRLFKVIYLNRRQQRRYRCNHYPERSFKLFAQKNNTDLFYSKYKSSLVPFAVFLIFKSARQSREQLIDDYVAIRT